MGSNATGAIFDEFYFILCNFRWIVYREKLERNETSTNEDVFLICKQFCPKHGGN